MIAYYFRVIDDENKHMLYFTIDQFCDPYGVEIKTAHRGGYCKQVEHTYYPEDSEHGEEDVYEESKFEFAEEEPLINDDEGWRKPVWPSLEELYAK